MFLFFYEMLLWLIAILAIPKTIYSFIFKKKYRQSLLYRFGIGFPHFEPHCRPAIWIHAVSVGETKAAAAIAKELKRLYPENPLVVSSTTETGHAEAKRSLSFADYHVFFPLDFKWVISKILKENSPALVVLCESDFWFNFLSQTKKRGAKLVLVNGKLSDRSMRRFSMIPFFSKKLFGLFDLLCVQNDLYCERFVNVGVGREKITITGNLKLDEDYPQLTNREVLDWRQKLGIEVGQIVLTIGSTHFPEEQFFIKELKNLWRYFPNLFVILVPRHPERFKEVGELLDRERIHWMNFSEINKQNTGTEKMILMDAMGLLRMCYQLSDIAIVGGSFTNKIGGHNILEPCWYGKPSLFGPYMHNQIEMVDLIIRYKAGLQLDKDQLSSTLERLIQSPQQAEEIGKNGLRLVKDLKGSSQKTLNSLLSIIKKSEGKFITHL